MAISSTLHDRSPASDAKRDEVHRVISDPVLRGSEALCQLLKYLADRSLDDPEQQVREHQIATEVFGRPETFDPRTDSTVRVQTSRLRSKLAEYYTSAGANNPFQIDIPKGSYSVVFRPKVMVAPVQEKTEEHPGAPPREPVERSRTPLYIAIALLLVLVAGWLLAQASFRTPSISGNSALALFWRGLLTSDEQPLVVFSNAEFIGRPETGIRYRTPADTNVPIFDQYTGVGEVFAVHYLDQVFAKLHRSYVLKRGRLLNWDDTKNRDLIFIGSPSENLPLRELPINKDFTFSRSSSGSRAGDLGILNVKPQSGEQSSYFGSATLPITEDYALIELGWTSLAAQPVLLLAGTTTFGTEAAVEFVCREDKLKQIEDRLQEPKTLPAFSAVLNIRVKGGVPLDSSIVAFRRD